tara:strand:+ start:54618 stop:54857 length:240 start_codon:yes stop_codon:yes gene_type:complete
MSNTADTIANIARDVCNPSVPDLSDYDRTLLSSGLDSLDYAGLLMTLEDKYGIKFSDDDMEDLNTINKLAQRIDAHQGG